MTQPAKVQEPSMEEILASIRRIIADDDAGKGAEAALGAAPAAEPRPAPVAPAAPPPPVAAAAPRPMPASMPAPMLDQEIDAVLAEIDAPEEKAGADVLDLTEAMAAPAPAPAAPAPSFRTIDAQTDVVFSDRVRQAAPEPASRVIEDARRQFPQAAERALMSPTTTAAVDTAFNSLANTILGQNARTLEDLVKEMLRPMLKSWLDDNLPGLVERIVRAEIERVSRGRM